MTPEIIKAKELKTQFGDNAKYVVYEIVDELKQISTTDHITFNLLCSRYIFWKCIKEIIENPKLQ